MGAFALKNERRCYNDERSGLVLQFGLRIMVQRRRHLAAFTLIEMLVVIAIIALLISIAMPHLQRARYESRITLCISNHHQWGNAILAYAGDNREALPRHDEAFTTGINTWDISNRFPAEMGRYGLNDHRAWDCAVTPLMPSTVKSFADAKTMYFNGTYTHFSIIPYNFWVPRKFGAVLFPSKAASPTSTVDLWPTHVGSPIGNTEPIMSDRVAKQTGLPATPEGAVGGHHWAGGLESTSLLFLDAHAERRIVDLIKVRYLGNWQNLY